MDQAPQAPMEMPQEASSPFANPDAASVYDQMRQTVSPKEFGDEMLAGASQVSPEDVAAFKAELDAMDVPMEVLDMLNNMVDEILAAPENYEQIKQKYAAMGVTDDILPEQFDPNFFAALNMAIDQMVAEPAGVQAFARGGIAELSPVSKAIASYGRNGDTMLAHITPAEARMLRRRGGAGTTNPNTGLKEYFSLGKLFKGIGNAVKKFASSTVGRVVTTVALGFFLGPAAASAMGIGAGTAAAAAVSGFVGGAGATLLGGGNLKDALKAGAIGGLTMGAIEGIGGAPLTGGTPLPGTTGEIIGGQFDKFANKFLTSTPASATTVAPLDSVAATAPPPAPVAPPVDASFGNPASMANPDFASINGAGSGAPGTSMFGSNPSVQFDTNTLPSFNSPAPVPTPTGETSYFDQAKDFVNKKISPAGIQEQAAGAAQDAGAKAVEALKQRIPTATPAMLESAYQTAVKAASPGMLATYGPATAVGIGTVAAFGGFSPKPLTPATPDPQMMKSVEQRIAEEGKQREYYVQNVPGVKYDRYGAPIFGQYVPLPTYSPTGYAGGGAVLTAEEQATKDAADKAAADAAAAQARTDAENAAARQVRIDAKNARLAQGSGEMYKNINAGLNVFAPTTNRDAILNERQRAFAPVMLKNAQFNSGIESIMANPIVQEGILNPKQPYNTAAPYTTLVGDPRFTPPADLASQTANQKAQYYNSLRDKGMTDAEIRFQVQKSMGPQADSDWSYLQNLSSANRNMPFNANMTANQKADLYSSMLGKGYTNDAIRSQAEMVYGKQSDQDWNYLQNLAKPPAAANARGNTTGDFEAAVVVYGPDGTPYGTASAARAAGVTNPTTTPPVGTNVSTKLMNMGGIAALAQGGYPRRTGQISGPGTATSDSIPAMLSDGEFVMTAKAVRGAGKGDRRAGAKRMYSLMNQLEQNASRG